MNTWPWRLWIVVALIVGTGAAWLLLGPNRRNDQDAIIERALLELHDQAGANLGGCTAVILKSKIDEAGQLDPWYIEVIHRHNDCGRVDSYYAGRQNMAGNVRLLVEQKWPGLGVRETLDLLRNAVTDTTVIVNGASAARISGDERSSRQTLRAPAAQWRGQASLYSDAALLEMSLADKSVTVTEKSLIRDAGKPKEWVGLRIRARSSHACGGSASPEQVDEYWLDSSRGYVIMLHVQQGDLTGTLSMLQVNRETLETGQADATHWYARRTRQTKRFALTENGVQKDVVLATEERIMIDTSRLPEPGLFVLPPKPPAALPSTP